MDIEYSIIIPAVTAASISPDLNRWDGHGMQHHDSNCSDSYPDLRQLLLSHMILGAGEGMELGILMPAVAVDEISPDLRRWLWHGVSIYMPAVAAADISSNIRRWHWHGSAYTCQLWQLMRSHLISGDGIGMGQHIHSSCGS
jgi:hypothetical protein